MSLPVLKLKKNEDRRLRAGHVWIYSNEIASPLKNFKKGEEVIVESFDHKKLGVAYINPHSLICARLFSRDIKDRLDQDFFIKGLTMALELRERLYLKPYYRLVFGESDSLPGLVIDRFDDILVMQYNTAGMDIKKDVIISALLRVLPETKTIVLRNDSRSRQYEDLPLLTEIGYGIAPSEIRLEENGTLFSAPLLEGQKTGWFYDHRLNRTRLKEYVKDQKVLDVFSYLGGWGIQAAHLGAEEVWCVDSSALSAAWIAKNSESNGVKEKVKIITDDAFDALKKLAQVNEKFSVIVIDPPAFVKKQKDLKEGLLAYQRINELALKLLVPNGILISCSCSMHVDNEVFMQILRKASLKSDCELQILERGHQAPDHPVHLAIPESDYLKMIVARRI